MSSSTAPREIEALWALAGHQDDVTYTLKVLAPPSPGEPRTVLFQRTGDGAAIEIRAETDAPNLLAKLPDFLEAALELQLSLEPPNVDPSLRSGLAARLAEEVRRLRYLVEEDAEERRRRALEHREQIREASIVRDIAIEALVNALGRERKPEIDALAKGASTPAALARSLSRLAEYLEQALRDPKDTALLIACDLDTAYAASLRRQAAKLGSGSSAPRQAPEDEPKERGLLRLIGSAYRTLRDEARMAGRGLEVLGRMLEASADSSLEARPPASDLPFVAPGHNGFKPSSPCE